jgi:hypothetical protein
MTLTIVDPYTGSRIIIEVATRGQPHRARRWVLRELDRIATHQRQASQQ